MDGFAIAIVQRYAAVHSAVL